MSTQLPGTLASHDALEAEHNFLPDFAWAAETPSRSHADRTLHADDAHIIRGETGATANPTALRTPMSGQAS